MFDERLGYDPDEWEECPESEHFLVFGFFTRFFLSAFAIVFAYYFFKLVESNKNKGKNGQEAEEEKPSPAIPEVHLESSRPLHSTAEPTIEYQAPSSVDALLQEASEYLNGQTSNGRDNSPRRFVEAQFLEEESESRLSQPSMTAPEGRPIPPPHKETVAVQKIQQLAEQQNIPEMFLKRDVEEEVRDMHKQIGDLLPRQDTFEEAVKQMRREQEKMEQQKTMETLGEEKATDFMPAPHFEEAFYTQSSAPRTPLEVEVKQDEKQGTSPKLSPRTDLSAQDQKALREWEWELAQLEADRLAKQQEREVGGEESELNSTNLLPATHISFHSTSIPIGIAEAPTAVQQRPKDTTTRQAVRDSDLTDYDISDFHAEGVALPIGEEPQLPVGGAVESRRTTVDSEEYVKVSAEPIYDEPPRADKPMTSEEARQLLELCQEYDFGSDVVAPALTLPTPPQHTSSAHAASQLSKGTVQEVSKEPQTDFRLPVSPNEDPRNMATAELFVQDALEYLNQQEAGPAGGFVIEEEMLSSHGTRENRRGPAVSGDPTSALVRTADVFERVEHDEHDDMTYAPEIQSVEIPPDQMSENSENLLEYFDRASAVAAAPSPAAVAAAVAGVLQKPQPQAPSIVSASAGRAVSNSSLASGLSSDGYPRLRKQSSLLSVLGVTSMQEMLLTITSLESLTEAMRKAGLSSTNVIFGIDYTASNKYQGEDSFGGRSLHTIHPSLKNPYQQVISILGRTLSPMTSTGCFPAFGFGDARTGDWSVFPLKQGGHCNTLDEVLKVYNEVTPSVDLSGPTNFAPLIHQAMEICQKSHDYHILVIIADGQVTNERATRRAIVQACQYPLSIIVVGVGDGPWDMMRVFDESLPKRPWDNFHFVEFNEIMKKAIGRSEADVQFAVQSLLEIPDQYRCICELGLLRGKAPPPRGSDIRKEMQF